LDGGWRNQGAVLEIALTSIHRAGKPVVVGVLIEKYDDGKRFVVRADEKLTAFLELESATYAARVSAM